MGILVVGRGFSGSLVSLLLADKGYDVLSADPNPVIPHCTGIVSRRFVELMGIEDLVLAEPERLIIRLGRLEFEYYTPRKAVVIDRERLDELLREASLAAGAKVIRKRVLRIHPSGEAVIDRLYRFDTIVDAEGAKRNLAKEFFGELETLPAVQYDVEADWEDVLIDLNIDGLFGRIVPLGKNKARIGLATRSGHLEKIKYLLRLSGAKRIVSRRGGLVVLSGPRGGLAKGRIMLVGDAAGVPKPLTAGGLAFGLLNAIVAARNVDDPMNYEREYLRLMGKEYRIQRILRLLKDVAHRVPRAFYPLFALIKPLANRLDMDFRSGIRTYPLSDIHRIRSYLAGSSRA